MIDGYAFINHDPQAVIVLDEELTKVDIVKRGWASWPVRILSDPKTEEMEGPVFPNEAEADKAVASRHAFKIGRWYYVLGPADYHTSKFEQPYWKKGGTTDEYVLNLISAALSAPTIDHPHTPYRYHFNTAGGERVDMTAWDFDVWKDGLPNDDLDYGAVIERTKLPGIGYSFVKSTLAYDNPKDDEQWPDSIAMAAEASEFFSVVINFPNCELGSDTCVEFRFKCETERVPFTTPRGGVGYNPKFTLCQLSYRQIYFPEKIRRIPLPRFQPRTATDAVSCYVMDRQSVKNFIDKLYTKDIYDKIKNMLYGDGAGNILSLKWFYGIRPAISTPQKRKITLGNVILDVSVPVFAGDFTQVYMGRVYVGGVYGDYRDYTNVRIQVFVPMVGMVDLDPSRVMGKNLHLIYTVNLTDGSAVVTLSTTAANEVFDKQNGWYETDNIVFTTSITYGYEIPLNVESIRSASLMVGEVVAKSIVGGAVGAIAGNVPGAVLGAIGGAATAADGVQSTYSSGSLSPNSNVMGDFKPKLYRTYNEDASGNIAEAAGRPSGKVVKVGNARGYLKAAMVYGTPTTAMQHTDEIVNMLKEGIYIS